MDIAHQIGFDNHWLHIFAGTESDADDLWRSWEKQAPGTVVRQVRGQKAKTQAHLFDEFAAAWQFPHYFGENWDAFEECITDLSWVRAETHVIGIRGCSQLLDAQPDKRSVLWSILGRAADSHAKPGHKNRTLIVAVQCLPTEEPRLRQLLASFSVLPKTP